MKKPTVKQAQALGVVGIVAVSAGAGFAGGWLGARQHGVDSSNTASQRQVISSEGNLISQIAKDVGPSVVSVNVTTQTAATRSLFGYSDGQQEGAGTGFVVGNNIIVPNRHVVPAGTTNVSIVLSDGTHLDDVEVLGRTNQSDPLDIAFLKVKDTKRKTLKPVVLGDSSKMQVGQRVVAIGNALGQFQNTVTSGILSGYGRDVQAGDVTGTSVENLQDLFQTDAAINEGNSGGPLVNMNGEVIGINTAVAGGAAQNIGFAIPINDVQSIINGVLKTGQVQRPYLGVHYISITDDFATANNLSVKRGAYVQNPEGVIADSPAARAGLQAGDIITKVDNTTLDENNSLSTVLGRYGVGQKVTLSVVRDGKTISMNVMLGTAPSS